VAYYRATGHGGNSPASGAAGERGSGRMNDWEGDTIVAEGAQVVILVQGKSCLVRMRHVSNGASNAAMSPSSTLCIRYTLACIPRPGTTAANSPNTLLTTSHPAPKLLRRTAFIFAARHQRERHWSGPAIPPPKRCNLGASSDADIRLLKTSLTSEPASGQASEHHSTFSKPHPPVMHFGLRSAVSIGVGKKSAFRLA
jgi:hypothetical protein